MNLQLELEHQSLSDLRISFTFTIALEVFADSTGLNILRVFWRSNDLYIYSNCRSKLTAIVVTRGYHIYENTSWTNAKMGEKVIMELETKITSLETNPFAFAIRLKIKFFDSFNLVGHISHKISRPFHFFIKTEGRNINRNNMSLTYRRSPIHSTGLEISLHLAFTCCQKESFDKVNGSNDSLYDWD